MTIDTRKRIKEVDTVYVNYKILYSKEENAICLIGEDNSFQCPVKIDSTLGIILKADWYIKQGLK